MCISMKKSTKMLSLEYSYNIFCGKTTSKKVENQFKETKKQYINETRRLISYVSCTLAAIQLIDSIFPPLPSIFQKENCLYKNISAAGDAKGLVPEL